MRVMATATFMLVVTTLMMTQASLGASNFYPQNRAESVNYLSRRNDQELKGGGGHRRLQQQREETAIPAMQVSIPSRRVFRFTFQPNLFAWKSGGNRRHGGVPYTYRPSLRGLPDLPGWLKYKYSHRHKAGFIYGVPPMPTEVLELDVVAMNR